MPVNLLVSVLVNLLPVQLARTRKGTHPGRAGRGTSDTNRQVSGRRFTEATQFDESEAAGKEGSKSGDEGGTDDGNEDGTGDNDEDGPGVGNVDEDVDPVRGNDLGGIEEDVDGDDGKASEVERRVVYRRRTAQIGGPAGEEDVDEQGTEEEVGERQAQRVQVLPDMPAWDVLVGLNSMIEGQGKYFRKEDLHGCRIKMTMRTMGERTRTEVLIRAYRHCGGNSRISAQIGSSGTYKGVKEHWIANLLSELDQGIMDDFKRSNVE
ncbi:hypothetical protein QFC21_006044 [Naganishia friedmannii]|uniref:Uncharacterized protein n=1 Tax=Naganishia friedmannii TaxID=89922 RepID=A0ACC2V518_9TREE|nr:hypothetical protein QFC21_006044 [Naganishia friedmannii]